MAAAALLHLPRHRQLVLHRNAQLPSGRKSMTRTGLALLTAGLIAAVIPAQAQQQAPAPAAPAPAAPAAPAAAPTAPARPQIETTKVDGTDNVYIFRNGNHQAMFIVTKDGVIATDPVAYGRPTGGQQYVDEIRKVTNKPIRYLIYSHHHFDHIAGGKAFKDAGARVIAHKRAKERLAQIKDPHTVIPDETVDKKKVIRLGGTTLELTYHGLNHSDSTLVMRLPKEKIVFIVDTIPIGSVPGRGFIDIYPIETEDFIKKVLAMDWERMIPGHPGPGGRLGTKEDAQNLLAFMQEASSEVQKAAREGKCWDAVEKEMKLPKYASWPNYENGLPFVLRRYCSLWGRGT
jgi:glyoxylase-like metal-dependent hydrolase (beta-lactamase superfamily II)